MSAKRREALSDIVLCLTILVVGVLVGWRGYYLTHDYLAPHCTEDEWISPETGECVHVDVIVDTALEEAGMVEVPR